MARRIPKPPRGTPIVSLTGNGQSRPEQDHWRCKCPPFGESAPECPVHNNGDNITMCEYCGHRSDEACTTCGMLVCSKCNRHSGEPEDCPDWS